MKKFFLIPLLTLMCSVMAWAALPNKLEIEPEQIRLNPMMDIPAEHVQTNRPAKVVAARMEDPGPAATNVAKIGTNEYATFAEALEAAQSGDLIELLANAEELTEAEFHIRKSLTIDGHNFTIPTQIEINGVENMSVTLKNLTLTDNLWSEVLWITSSQAIEEINLENVNIINDQSAIYVKCPSATINMKDVVIDVSSCTSTSYGYGFREKCDNITFNMDNVEIHARICLHTASYTTDEFTNVAVNLVENSNNIIETYDGWYVHYSATAYKTNLTINGSGVWETSYWLPFYRAGSIQIDAPNVIFKGTTGFGSYNKGVVLNTGKYGFNPAAYISDASLSLKEGNLYSIVSKAAMAENYAAYIAAKGIFYPTIEDAFNAAGAYETVMLLRDVATPLVISRSILIDPDGKNIDITAGSGYVKGTMDDGRIRITAADPHVQLSYAGFQHDYPTIQEAFANLPANSTPATVTVMSDLFVEYTNSGTLISLSKYHNVTLDLNGYTVYAITPIGTASTSLIDNKGTLTITDGSAGKTGKMANFASNVEQWQAQGMPFPSKYNNLITNHGTLIVEGGTLENLSPAGACYVVDNQTNGDLYTPKLIINGGLLKTEKDQAIRLFCNSYTNLNEVVINGGEVIGTRAVWLQLPGSDTSKSQLGSFTMNGGTIRALDEADAAFAVHTYGCKLDKVNVAYTGGSIYGYVYVGGRGTSTGVYPVVTTREKVAISGGTYYPISEETVVGFRASTLENNPMPKCIIGGTYYTFAENPRYDIRDSLAYAEQVATVAYWEGQGYNIHDGGIYNGEDLVMTVEAAEEMAETLAANYVDPAYWEAKNLVLVDSIVYESFSYSEQSFSKYVKDGYCGFSRPADLTDANKHYYWTTIAPCQESKPIVINGNWADATTWGGSENIPTEEVIVTVPQGATITVEEGTDAAAHTIQGEGQVVVEYGATLVVGDGGIVSENNDLTTVVVKPGGTVIVGNGGVDQQGQATPVEIQSTDSVSGVFMVDPNAPIEVAEAPAKVKVYTRAYSKAGEERWQQFASPVKGDSKNKDTIIVTPLVDNSWNWFETSIYSWDYTTDSWVRITTGEGMTQNDQGAHVFGKAGWKTTSAVLKPFAAYDLINNSWPSDGGITYEFAGELVGNSDLVLSFPENGFCTFGNSYTAPIDLETFFVTVKNDIQYDYDNNNQLIATSAIDPCVYIFNSEKNRFESVNSAALKLKNKKKPAFEQIPPQQAFVMNLLKGNSAQSSVDYATSVWGNPNTNKNTAIMAPKRQEEINLSAMFEITVTDGNATDRVMFIEDEEYSSEYDFGADAMKYMDGAFNLYANTAIGQLDMVATDNIENTELSFKAGNAVTYTMSFNDVEGEFVLVDHLTNSQVAVAEGGIYTFAAQPNSTVESRFEIVPAAKLPTAIGNTEVKADVKGIYTILGQYVGENFEILPAGAYIVNGVKIIK